MTPSSSLPTAAVLAAVLVSAACEGRDGGARTIEAARPVEPRGGVAWDATTAQRFGFERAAPQAAAAPHLHWDTPAGWEELPPSSMREADFRVAGDPDTSCYLTTLSGEGGGLAANVNRWRQQMGLEAWSEEVIAGLPRVPFLGGQAALVDLEGSWSGMNADGGQEGFRLLGLLLVTPERSRFLKLVGPIDVVTAQADAFERLAASFREDSGSHDPHAPIASGASGAPGLGSTVASGPAAGGPAPLAWEAPAGWVQEPPRTMRAVSFRVGDDAEGGGGECYVVVLAGDGGGLAANVNRWRAQMGQDDLSGTEIEALEEVPMLGGAGQLVAIDGHYSGMGDADVPEASLLGAVRLLGDRSVFVKMIAPTPVVEAEREAFIAFCGSLRDGE